MYAETLRVLGEPIAACEHIVHAEIAFGTIDMMHPAAGVLCVTCNTDRSVAHDGVRGEDGTLVAINQPPIECAICHRPLDDGTGGWFAPFDRDLLVWWAPEPEPVARTVRMTLYGMHCDACSDPGG